MADECTKKEMQRRSSFAYAATSSSEQKNRRISVAVNGLESRSRHNHSSNSHHGHSSSMNVLEGFRVTSRHGSVRQRRNEDFNCSQQSILTAMDRFVKTIHNMNSTILVPSKLRDMDITGKNARMNIPQPLANSDLYSFYLMLNDVKKELLWGPGTAFASVSTFVQPISSSTSSLSSGERLTNRELKHIRHPSDDSLGSLGSTASSSDPETDSDADSLLTDRDSMDEPSSHLAAAFRHHLQGLHTILHQLADSAEYLLTRYQEDVESGSL